MFVAKERETHTVGKPPDDGAADEHSRRTQGKRFDDVDSSSNAAIHENFAASSHGPHHLNTQTPQTSYESYESYDSCTVPRKQYTVLVQRNMMHIIHSRILITHRVCASKHQ